jgi:3-oxoacyl-[acyl-carrier-protein] synthase-3
MNVFRPASMNRGVRLASVASHLPARVVTNADLVALGAPLSDDEMVRLCGVRERRWVADGEATSDLAVAAAKLALARAGIDASHVDRLVVGTVSPDYTSPSCACLVQHALGMGHAPAFDLTASCSGFLYALDCAARAIATGDRNVLAVAADVRSRFLDVHDRATCALFGDGAGAALLTECPPGEGLLAIGLVADGSGARSVYVPAGGSREPATAETVAAGRHTIRMEEGPQVYLTAIEGMLSVAEQLLASLGMTFADVDLVVPHQPNLRILERMAKLARLPPEKVFVNIEGVGNVSGATCAIALDAALAAGRARAGDLVLLVSAGAGYTAGAALLSVDPALAGAGKLP